MYLDKFGRFKFNGTKERKSFLSNLDTREKIQKFIDDNNFSSRYELGLKFRSLKIWSVKLGVWDSLIFKKGKRKSLNSEIDNYNTTEDFQNFIKEKNIKTKGEFRNSFREFYKKAKNLGIVEKLLFTKYEEVNLKDFNTLEDFQILANNFNSLTEFYCAYENVVRKFNRLKATNKITGELKFRITSRNSTYNGTFTTKEEFENYVKENNLKSSKEFELFNKILYKRMHSLKISIKYEERHETRDLKIDDYSKYETIDDIQEFIIKHEIYSKTDLKLSAKTIYLKYLKLREETGRDVIFMKISNFESKGEFEAIKELVKYGVLDCRIHFKLPEKDGIIRFMDIFSPSLNAALEIHGPQHFSDETRPKSWDERDEIENDKLKYNLAKAAGLDVYYITYDSWDLYKKYNYFKPVYRSVKDLFNSLGIEIHENPNYKQDLMRLFSGNLIELINKICKNSKIHNQSELNKFDNIFSLASEFDLLDKLTYYSEEQDLQEQ